MLVSSVVEPDHAKCIAGAERPSTALRLIEEGFSQRVGMMVYIRMNKFCASSSWGGRENCCFARGCRFCV